CLPGCALLSSAAARRRPSPARPAPHERRRAPRALAVHRGRLRRHDRGPGGTCALGLSQPEALGQARERRRNALMRRLIAFAPFALLGLLIAVAALVLARGSGPATFTEGQIGRPAPSFSLARLGTGEPVTNEAFRGRTYLINLFGSYCVPCRAEHPLLLGLKA